MEGQFTPNLLFELVYKVFIKFLEISHVGQWGLDGPHGPISVDNGHSRKMTLFLDFGYFLAIVVVYGNTSQIGKLILR